MHVHCLHLNRSLRLLCNLFEFRPGKISPIFPVRRSILLVPKNDTFIVIDNDSIVEVRLNGTNQNGAFQHLPLAHKRMRAVSM
jgi:hypothetical protein